MEGDAYEDERTGYAGSMPLSDSDVKKKLLDSFEGDSALRVYLRLRPLTCGGRSEFSCLQVLDSKTVLAAPLSTDSANNTRFKFSQVFDPAATQEGVFETAAASLIDNLVAGKNVLMFAYGPTSSGKTYTMMGPFANPGIIPRAMEKLFKVLGNRIVDACLKPLYFEDVAMLNKGELNRILQTKAVLLARHKEKQMASFDTFVLSQHSEECGADGMSISQIDDVSFIVWLSFYEVYNENVYDLLDTKSIHKQTCLKVGQDPQKQSYLKGICEVPVMSADEAYALLCVARSNLHTSTTILNHRSSRSHSCFNIRLIQYSGEEGKEEYVLSTLTLCDLAGSERSDKAGTSGGTLREAGRINNSLMVLSRCLESLRNSQNSSSKNLVPFRESKLTQIMQPFFTSGGSVHMVVNVNPDALMAKESFHALKLSAIASEVVPVMSKPNSRIQESCSRLTELWQKSSRRWSSVGIGRDDRALTEVFGKQWLEDSIEDEFGSEEVEELFQNVQILKEKAEKAEKEVERWKGMCTTYENYIDKLKKKFDQFEEMHEKDLERQIELAREGARLDLYDEAEAGSNLDLLGQLEAAKETIRILKERLDLTGETKNREDMVERLAELQKDKEQCEENHKQELSALKEEYEEKVSSLMSALTLKEKLLEDSSSEASLLKVQVEALEKKLSSEPSLQGKLEELQKGLQDRDSTIEDIQKRYEDFRRESARKLESQEQDSTAAQLKHEKDMWVMRTELKVKDDEIKRLLEELDKERERNAHAARAFQDKDGLDSSDVSANRPSLHVQKGKRQTPRRTRLESAEKNVEEEFKVPKRRTRAAVAAAQDDESEKVTPARRSVLVEQNSRSGSPLKRLGDYFMSILPGSTSDENAMNQKSSAKKRRGRKPFLSTEPDCLFENDMEESQTKEPRPVRTRSRRN